MLRKELHEQNRLSWNEATLTRNSHKADQAKFFREGGSTLFQEEIELLGDIHELSLVHLQCNYGRDTLSLAQLGARATGVDISDTAIDLARKLSEESGTPATFHCMDVYDWLEEASTNAQRYDVAFSSYGFIFWLSDIKTWARGVASILKPGGRFVMVELHPFMMTLDEHWNRSLPYFFGNQVMSWADKAGPGGSGDDEMLIPSDEVSVDPQTPRFYEFHWGIGEVITALLDAGLAIMSLKEYPYFNGDNLWFKETRQLPGRRMTSPEGMPNLPLMYSVVAEKTGRQL